MSTRVLIVDDHASFRALARRLLDADGFCVVGEAADGAGAVAAVHRLRPDVVLLDVQLPDLDGFAVADRLLGRPGAPAVVLTSSRSRSDYGERLDRPGICGFIPKDELSGAELERVMGGGR